MGAKEREQAQERFSEAKREFIAYLSGVRNLSENTVRAYQTDLDAYLAWLGREGIDGATVSHRQLRRYLADLARAGYSTRTVNRHLSAIRGLYKWLLSEERIRTDAAAALASPKIARVLPHTLSDADAESLIRSCDGQTPEDLRDRAFLELLYATGARISEMSRLDVSDVDFARAQVQLFGKGSKERIVPIYEQALAAVRTYLQQGRGVLASRRRQGSQTNALFVSTRGNRMSADALRTRFERRAQQSGAELGVTPHAMRHTYATELLSGGADLRSVQELLGHESLATTQIYTHVSVDRLKEATRQAHPRGE